MCGNNEDSIFPFSDKSAIFLTFLRDNSCYFDHKHAIACVKALSEAIYFGFLKIQFFE